MRATVITDASWCQYTGAGGWAGWIRCDGNSGPIKAHGILKAPVTSSTLAEVMAAANGVWVAASQGATAILIQSDCMAVIHLVQKQTKNPQLLAVWKRLVEFPELAGCVISARHVKGHAPIKDARGWVNHWCDSHARKHMEEQRRVLRNKTR